MPDPIVSFVTPIGIASPCIMVCTLDTATGWCLGCGRTGDEIERWTSMGEAGRQAVSATLPARMDQLLG